MALASTISPATTTKLAGYVGRSLEVLWLLTLVMVPLIFVPTDFILSEAVNAYVEVPKTVALRTLVGIIAILWIVEWVLYGGLNRRYTLARYLSRLKHWVAEEPTRWVVVAATAYVVVAVVTTFLSVAVWKSLWGEVSGQFGYSGYTTVSYLVLFAVIATHLKTRAQLWRLLGVIVATGTLVGFYGIIQHYGRDPLNLGESGSFRVSATMANSVFAGSLLVITGLLTFGIAFMALDRWRRWPLVTLMLGAFVVVQLLAVHWTGARGSWVLGVPPGLLAFLVLVPLALGHRNFPASSLGIALGVLVLGGAALVLLVLLIGGVSLWGLPAGLGAGLGAFLVLALFTRGPLPWRSNQELLLVLATAWVLVLVVAVVGAVYVAEGYFLWQAVPGLLFYLLLVGVNLHPGTFLKGAGLLAGALAISVLVVSFSPSPADSTDAGGADQVQERLSTVQEAVVGRGVSFRTDIWEASWGLIKDRPWFEYEGLTLSPIRHLVGYGPEMFKYTFPLESPLGGLLSHAHNFFIHHAVEQGVLGFLASVGLFVAFFAVGGAQLWRNRDTYSTTHKWLLVILLSTMVGRVAEMMVGVNRESDLVIMWALMAVFVVLPSVMKSSPEAETAAAAAAAPHSAPLTRRQERRGRRDGPRDPRTRQPGGGIGVIRDINPARTVALLAAVCAVIFLGWLTWDKNVDYIWAARLADEARDESPDGRLQDTERLFRQAVAKAPDVPTYYNNLAATYSLYRDFALANPDRELPECELVFPIGASQLEPTEGTAPPYSRCAEEEYLAHLRGFRKNVNSPQAKLSLANSTFEMAILGYAGKEEEAEGYYQELTNMLPWSWPLYQALGNFYDRFDRHEETAAAYERALAAFETAPDFEDRENLINASRQLVRTYNDDLALAALQAARPADALEHLEKSLALTQDSAESGRALFIQGLAYQALEEPINAAASLERSLEVDEDNPEALTIHRQLAQIYAGLEDQARADEHARLADELAEG